MSIILHCGDCLEYMRNMANGSVDAVITDPPYGVSLRYGQVSANRVSCGAKHGTVRFVDSPIYGDHKPFDPAPFLNFPVVILFGANNYADKLPPSRGWIFWHKRPGMERNDFGDGELIWINQDRVLRYYKHMWNGVLRDSEVGEEHYHPTQKPVAIFSWLLQEYTKLGDTIFDPFMGSGSCGIACVRMGRSYIGVEIDPGYFAIAQRRISQEQLQPALFHHEERAEQMELICDQEH